VRVPLGADDVGHRVVLRRFAGQRDGRPLFSDVLGELLAWGDVAVVRTGDGSEISIPRDDVASGKRIPPKPARKPPPHRAVADLELERIAALGWRGLRTERLGGWLLRSSGGWTGRANSVLPLGAPGLDPDPERDLTAALAAVRAWYAEVGQRALIQVPLPVRTDLRDALLARGWEDAWGALVMTAGTAETLAALPARPDLPTVELTRQPSEAWLAAYHYRGGALPAVAVDVLRTGAAPVFGTIVEDGRVLAVARAAVDEGWIGVTAVEVDAGQRRRGLAKHLLRGILQHGLLAGAHSAYLQTEDSNVAARALYEGVGFAVHHSYRYLREPS
jgi:ribosomal protein S18 acetylase RimI-like enzyme